MAQDRREDFRALTSIRLRVRSAGRTRAEADLGTAWEDAAEAAAAARPELGPQGRVLVDKLLALTDLMAGEITRLREGEGGHWLFDGTTDADLSAGGLGFPLSPAPPQGARLDLEFQLPPEVSAIPFRVTAEVVHTGVQRGGGWVGVRFVDVPTPVQARLARAVLDVQRARLRARVG
jgi:hypothetical protein